jgi:hypothetical protein
VCPLITVHLVCAAVQDGAKGGAGPYSGAVAAAAGGGGRGAAGAAVTNGAGAAALHARPHYSGLMHAVRTIISTEGFRAMYQVRAHVFFLSPGRWYESLGGCGWVVRVSRWLRLSGTGVRLVVG